MAVIQRRWAGHVLQPLAPDHSDFDLLALEYPECEDGIGLLEYESRVQGSNSTTGTASNPLCNSKVTPTPRTCPNY